MAEPAAQGGCEESAKGARVTGCAAEAEHPKRKEHAWRADTSREARAQVERRLGPLCSREVAAREERVILKLSCSFSVIRSSTLVRTLYRIISLVLPSLARRVEALALGLRVVEERVRQALSLGYYQALEWLKDISFAMRVGLSLMNVPKAYWPEVT